MSVDGEPLSAGFYLSDVYRICHTITDQRAYDTLFEAIVAENVNAILPTSASDTPVFAAKKNELAKNGIVFAGCDDSAVNTCDDKASFYRAVQSKFHVPRAIELIERFPSEFPCYIKPRCGSGGHGGALCRDERDWNYFRPDIDDLIVQEYLPGKEYSVDVLCDLDGVPIVAVPRERISTMDGVSVRCKVVRHEEMEDSCLRMARFLGIKGAACMQLKCDRDGRLHFLEVNARLGGSNIVTTLAGVNFPQLLLSMVRGNAPSAPNIREITVLRFFDEVEVR